MPLITFRTVSQELFQLELDSSLTIRDVKQRISEEKGEEFPVEQQRLIFNGKFLQDEVTVGEAKLEEAKFIVVFITRKKEGTPPAPVQQQPQPVEETPAAEPSESVDEPIVQQPLQQQSLQEAAPGSSFTPDQDAAIDAIIGMGYPTTEAVAALQAAYWNADRAVEYLLTGVPDGVIDEEQVEMGGDVDLQQFLRGGLLGVENLATLRGSPYFEQIKAHVRAHPEMLPDVMQSISVANPRLFEDIQNNQEEFLGIVNAPPDAVEAPVPEGAYGVIRQGNQDLIQLTRPEAQALQRIKAMFKVTDALLIEAFMACERDEVRTINYILNRLEDDRRGGQFGNGSR